MSHTHSASLTSILEVVDDDALRSGFRFLPDEGRIKLLGQRMLLMHAFSLAALRHELIERLGFERVREMFTRLGYSQGVEDSRNMREHLGNDLLNLLSHGPRLREMEGFVRNRAIERMSLNAETGEFRGDYFWESSWEAEAHLKQYGVSGSPACWMMTGYANGFTTSVFGRPIVWREIECVAMGHSRCRVIGTPIGEYGGGDLRFLPAEDIVATAQPSGEGAKAGTDTDGLRDLIGVSPGLEAAIDRLKRVAPTDATVLLTGESGVGKERFSRALHCISPRSRHPFVSINCAAIPHDLVEAELFGVEKGAYTGAVAARPGRFERAQGGTLFLDEVGSLPLSAQGKLLRVLQEREIERVGSIHVRSVDVRVIAAANRDLRDEVKAGRFREDLFFRLNVFPIEIPPLRERREDIPLMLNTFVRRFAHRFHKTVVGISQRASEALRAYDWPGNVRELENMVQRAVILVDDGASLDVHHLFSGGEQLPGSFFDRSIEISRQPLRAPDRAEDGPSCEPPSIDSALRAILAQVDSFEEVETLLLEHAMARSCGNVSAAARMLKLRRGQVEYRLKKRSATAPDGGFPASESLSP